METADAYFTAAAGGKQVLSTRDTQIEGMVNSTKVLALGKDSALKKMGFLYIHELIKMNAICIKLFPCFLFISVFLFCVTKMAICCPHILRTCKKCKQEVFGNVCVF
jgi:hypothetical protein